MNFYQVYTLAKFQKIENIGVSYQFRKNCQNRNLYPAYILAKFQNIKNIEVMTISKKLSKYQVLFRLYTWLNKT